MEIQIEKHYLLEADGLKKVYPSNDGLFNKETLTAVNNVSLSISRGEIFGLVGESGCGKSTLARMLLLMVCPSSGVLKYDGKKYYCNGKRIKFDPALFQRNIQMVFQNPSTSISPYMTIEQIIGEPLDINKLYRNKKERQEYITSCLEKVGLEGSYLEKYPHELSGGQQQRVGIARALAVNPEFLICDEPLSALDVQSQYKVLRLLINLKQTDLTYLFISHDIRIVKNISDRMAVMYRGCIVEMGKSNDVYSSPIHPYTQILLNSVKNNSNMQSVDTLSSYNFELIQSNCGRGCRFSFSCPLKKDVCSQLTPELQEISNGHYVACHNYCNKI